MFNNQKTALAEIKSLAQSEIRSILISGSSGCGKTYLAKVLSDTRKCDDFIIVDPKMQDVREAMYDIRSDSRYTICIENLDTGVTGVSNAILKFVESPKENVTVVITCRRRDLILETIRSRCTEVRVSPLSKQDLEEYVTNRYPAFQKVISIDDVWSAVTSTTDIDWLSKLTDSQLRVFPELFGVAMSASPVNTITWKLSKFSDGTAIDPNFMMKYLMKASKDPRISDIFRRCLDDMDMSIPYHAALANAVISIKYGGFR